MINAPFSCCSLFAIFENCSESSSTIVPAALTAAASITALVAAALILTTFSKAFVYLMFVVILWCVVFSFKVKWV